MTQVRLAWEKWRSSWIRGSATFTIVVSSTIISWARQTTTSASQRRRSWEIMEVLGVEGEAEKKKWESDEKTLGRRH